MERRWSDYWRIGQSCHYHTNRCQRFRRRLGEKIMKIVNFTNDPNDFHFHFQNREQALKLQTILQLVTEWMPSERSSLNTSIGSIHAVLQLAILSQSVTLWAPTLSVLLANEPTKESQLLSDLTRPVRYSRSILQLIVSTLRMLSTSKALLQTPADSVSNIPSLTETSIQIGAHLSPVAVLIWVEIADMVWSTTSMLRP